MKKVYSVVWQFFDRLEENNRCVAVFCKLCDTKYKYVGNTTNLRGHLIRKHPLHWELGQNKKIIDSLNSSSTVSQRRWKYSSSRDENVRYSFIILIIVNNYVVVPVTYLFDL